MLARPIPNSTHIAPTSHPPGGLTRNLRQNSSMELISEPWTCRKAALYCTKRREQAAVYLGRGRAQGQHGRPACARAALGRRGAG